MATNDELFLNLPAWSELKSDTNRELLEQLLSHLAWFSFNLIFFLNLESNLESEDSESAAFKIAFIFLGSMVVVCVPLLSFIFVVKIKMEHLARSLLWAFLMRTEKLWVNFKNRSVKKFLTGYYIVTTLGSMAFSFYGVSDGEKQVGACFGSLVNGLAAYLTLRGIWDFESSLPSLNRVLLDGLWLKGNQIDSRGVNHLMSCTVIEEHILKRFCFGVLLEAAQQKKSGGTVSTVSLSTLKNNLSVYTCDQEGFAEWKKREQYRVLEDFFLRQLFHANAHG